MNQYPGQNPYAAPQAFAPQAYAPSPYAPDAGTLRVEGKLLVAANGSALPPMCLKCGGAPTHLRAQKYQYTPPWALFFMGWLGILLFSKRASFQVPLCEAHRAEWKRWNLIAGFSWLPGALFWILGGAVSGSDDGVGAALILTGTVLFLVGLVAALVVRSRKIVMPTRIDGTHSWLRGVHPVVLQAVSQSAAVTYPAAGAAPPQGYAPQGAYPG